MGWGDSNGLGPVVGTICNSQILKGGEEHPTLWRREHGQLEGITTADAIPDMPCCKGVLQTQYGPQEDATLSALGLYVIGPKGLGRCNSGS